MAAEVYVHRADEADAHLLAPRVIQAEVDELRASMDCTPLEALLRGVRTSAECWAVWFDSELAFMWGVVRQQNGNGLGWLLASDVVQRNPLTFWRHCLEALPAVLERWPMLVNAIDVRHERALRWGSRLGFEWGLPLMEMGGQQFAPFRITKEGHQCAVQRG